jgi:hypothetical protein
MKWTTGPKKVRADRVRERGRRWYDAETLRRKGIPPAPQEAAKWLAEQLQFGDQNGDAMFGGGERFRYEAEAEAERTGEPVRFVPYNPEEQKYGPAAVLLRGGAAPQPAATAAAPVPAVAPVPAAVPPPAAGTPAGWIPYRNARTGEVRYNAPGKAGGDWTEVR